MMQKYLTVVNVAWFIYKGFHMSNFTSPPSNSVNNDIKHAYKAFIPDIFLELPDYKFNHHPVESAEQKFFGRKVVLDKLANILRSSDLNRGAYLVTGYRGMGKTSYVRKAISEYKASIESDGTIPKKRIIDHHISFAQNDLKELDILRQITKFIKDDLKKNDRLRYVKYLQRKTTILFYSCLTFASIFIFLFVKSGESFEGFSSKDVVTNLLFISVVSGLLIHQSIGFVIYIIRRYSSLGDLVSIMRQIDILYDRCQGELASEKGVEGTSEQLPLGFISRTSKKYNPLSAKEAEHELINILEKYNNIRFFDIDISLIWKPFVVSVMLLSLGLGILIIFIGNTDLGYEIPIVGIIQIVIGLIFFKCALEKVKEKTLKKEFIFIFDELDKIEPKTGKEYFSENVAASTNLHYDTYTNSIRERREMIIGLLSSLKYFVSEANSRFIFIAGREMFDASLADISDRQSSLSSIFHQVVYVDSFYRDLPDNRKEAAGIGEMVEEYLERILIPSMYLDNSDPNYENIGLSYNDHFLSNYYKYVSHAYMVRGKRKDEVLKIIFTLQNFIIYITYRSNGSPKKMVRLLEENIVSLKNRDDKYMIVTYNTDIDPNALFLKFSFKKQYKLGFTSYLFRPFLLMYGNFIRQYGDSLLVSTPYLIDNIIKFHPFAFSVKNLELLPEVISSNKSPELRSFIEKLVFFLSQNHIRETESGLFEHKFYDRTHNEIAFLSKIAEEESAAFNFSLDENYPIKKHLVTRINELRNHHKDFKNGSNSFSGSLSFLHDLLGDAELYDDEFEDAIISYSDAIHVLDCPTKVSEFSTEQLILYVRFKLKIGLAHEKMKAYDVAMGHYSDSFRRIKDYIVSIEDPDISGDETVMRELIQFASRSLAAIIFVQEKLEEGLTFQKIKKFNQTFISLISATGKKDYAGRDIIEAKHYTQIAILAFFKNLTFPYNFDVSPQRNILGMGQSFNPKLLSLFNNGPLVQRSYVEESFDELASLHNKSIFNKVNENVERDFRFSFISYVYYKKSLASYLSESQQSGSLGTLIVNCFDLIHKFDNKHGKNVLIGIGNTLSRLGDLLFTLYKAEGGLVNGSSILRDVIAGYRGVSDPDKSVLSRLDSGFMKILQINNNQLPKKNKTSIELDGILSIYYVSARFFLKAGRTNSASFHFRKMLMLIKSFAKFGTPKDLELIQWLEDSLLNKMLEISSWNNHSSDRPQILKYKDYFGVRQIQTPRNFSRFIYTNLSNNPEVKESILLLASLKIKSSNYNEYISLDDFVNRCPEQQLVTKYNSVAHQLSRIMELEIQVQMNYKFMKESLDTKLRQCTGSVFGVIVWQERFEDIIIGNAISIRDYSYDRRSGGEVEDIRKLLQISNPNCPKLRLIVLEYFQIIANSVHCLHQTISILNTYGVTHFLNQSYLGGVHEKLGDWLKHLHLCKMLCFELGISLEMDTVFNKLLGFRVINTLDVLPQYQYAMQCYYEAYQVHNEGASYKFMIGNFIYLEDDYYDNLGHFGASLERQRINSGSIRLRINKLINITKSAGILKYDNLVNAQPF
jgi:hypothetical protein